MGHFDIADEDIDLVGQVRAGGFRIAFGLAERVVGGAAVGEGGDVGVAPGVEDVDDGLANRAGIFGQKDPLGGALGGAGVHEVFFADVAQGRVGQDRGDDLLHINNEDLSSVDVDRAGEDRRRVGKDGRQRTVNPSPPGHRRTVTRNQISYQSLTALRFARRV